MKYHFLPLWMLLLLPAYLSAQESPVDSVSQHTVATLATRSRNAQAQAHFQQAVQLEKQSRLPAALQSLNQALAFKHDHEEALWLRARLKRRNEDPAGALSDYQAFLYLVPDHIEARFERAQLLYRLNRYETALADFKYLLENTSGETSTVYFRGAEQTTGGTESFVAESATTVQSGIQTDIWNFMGLCYLELEAFSKAATYFELALSQRAQDPNLHSNLGLTSERSGDTLQAIQHYSNALTLQPNHPIALQNFSYLTRKTNRLDLAEAAFQKTSSTEEASPQSLLHQGMIQHQQGKYQQAIALYDRAIAKMPHEADFYLQRGFSHEKLLHLDQAFQDYSFALQLNPTLEKAFVNRGNVLYKQKKLDQAIQDYERALKLHPNNAKVYFNIGLCHHRMRQYSEACAYLDKALQLGYKEAQPVLQKICKAP